MAPGGDMVAPMRLEHLALRDFRNLTAVSVDTDARFVVFHGPNAQGKTNLLEAIYGLATLKAFRTTRNRELIRWGQDEAVVAGRVWDGELRRRFRFTIGPKGRRGEVDGKPPRSLGEYFNGIRAVLFSPEDVEIVRGSPSVRRRFLDRAAFTANAGFLAVAREFQRLLDQKGSLLRRDRVDTLQLDIFDEQLAVAGAALVERRQRILGELKEPFLDLHKQISGLGKAHLRYRSCLGEGGREELALAYQELLAGARAEELRRGMNLVGPQRDDLVLKLDDRAARAYASQGQTRSLVLALKLAELLAARARGDLPLFLLDDLSSELDRFRTGRLVELLKDLELQCFVTTTDPGVVQRSAGQDMLAYAVDGGALETPETA